MPTLHPSTECHQKNLDICRLSKQLLCIRCFVLSGSFETCKVGSPKSPSRQFLSIQPSQERRAIEKPGFLCCGTDLHDASWSSQCWWLGLRSLFRCLSARDTEDSDRWLHLDKEVYFKMMAYKLILETITCLGQNLTKRHWPSLVFCRHSFSSPTECFRKWRSSEKDSTNYWQGSIQKNCAMNLSFQHTLTVGDITWAYPILSFTKQRYLRTFGGQRRDDFGVQPGCHCWEQRFRLFGRQCRGGLGLHQRNLYRSRASWHHSERCPKGRYWWDRWWTSRENDSAVTWKQVMVMLKRESIEMPMRQASGALWNVYINICMYVS